MNKIWILLKQAFIALCLGISAFLISCFLFIMVLQAIYAGRLLPGIQVGGVEIGGLPIYTASMKLRESFDYPQSGQLKFVYQSNAWVASPVQLGISFNADETIQNAFQIGHSGPLDKWIGEMLGFLDSSRVIPPVLLFDQDKASIYLKQIASQIERPTQEAALEIRGTDVIAKTGQTGISLDMQATLQNINTKVLHLENGLVSLVVNEQPPDIIDVSQYAEIARNLLKAPLSLTAPSEQVHSSGPWIIPRETLASMLVFERKKDDQGTTLDVRINEQVLKQFLVNLSQQVNHPAENPRFIFNDDTRQLELIKPGFIGRELDVVKSVSSIQENLNNGKHTIPLEFIYSSPHISNDASAEQLGIRQLIHTENSYFYGSSPARIQNIQTAASRFHGLLIAPGETFSMAKAVGEISLNTGFTEALIIYNERTIEGLGGGVCQVSTTLFRAALFSGFPIVERHPHAYRVKFYEKIAGNRLKSDLAGLDATVYFPVVDLKFKNDTPYWLLMETYVYPKNTNLIWKLYSTSDNRTVHWTTSGPINLVEPPDPLYKENPSLSRGEIEQVDWEAQGADVTVNRAVYKNNTIYLQDNFFTHYEPWRAVYEYGPGTEGIPQRSAP